MSSAVAVRTDTRHPSGVIRPTVRQATDVMRLQVRLAFFRREWSRQTTPLAFTCGTSQNIHSNCTTSHPVERPAFDGSWFQRNRLTPYGEAPIATQNSYPALNLQYLMNHFAECRMHRAASTRIGLLFSFDALCQEHRP